MGIQSKKKWALRLPSMLFPLLVCIAPRAFAAADHFVFTVSPSGLFHTVDETVNYTVEARNPDNSKDSGFAQSVTIGLYDSVSNNLSDALAVIANGGVTLGIGTAIVPFVGGSLSFQLTFKTGADSELLYILHPTITNGNNVGPYQVKGYTVNYYLLDADGNTTPAVFPGANDLLSSDPAVATSPTSIVEDIPFSSDGSNASVFVITGITGQYAAGGANLIGNIVVKKKSGVPPTKISYKIILDYTGDLPATGGANNYLAPRTVDTVYELDNYAAGNNFAAAPLATLLGGNAPVNSGVAMNNGQAVLMVWNNSASPAQILLKTPASPVSQFASNISVPFSAKNVSPVEGSLTPKQVLANASTSMVYVISDFSAQQIKQTRFNLPFNPGGTQTPWTLSSAPTTRAGGTVTYVNPSGTTNGYVNIDWSSVPVTPGESVSVTLNFNPASQVQQSNWDFSFLIVKDTTGTDMITDSNAAKNIDTLGAPSIPTGFTASPGNFTSTGNEVDLAWGQVTDQAANGYIISRRSPAGSGAFSPLTILQGSGTTSFADTTVVNVTSNYDYQIQAMNSVTSSGGVTSNAVTAFANPGSPTAAQVLTGGVTLRLSWTAPAAVPGSFPVTGYQVWRGTTLGSMAAITNVPSTAVSFNDLGPFSAGVSYFYFVSSLDSQYSSGVTNGPHNSGPSNTSSGFPPGNPPNNMGISLVSSTAPVTIGVSWTAPTSALDAPVSYQVYRSDLTVPTAYAPLTLVPAATVSINDSSSLTFGHTFGYYVKAIDGNLIASNASTTVTQSVGPSAPTGLVAAASFASINLTWTANPGGQSVTDYQVFRNGSQIGATTGVAYSDGTAVLGTDYGYQIKAVAAGIVGPASGAVSSALLPAISTGFTIIPNAITPTTFNINWTAIPEANLTGYRLIRGTSSTLPTSNPVTFNLPVSSSTTDSGLSSGSIYYYFLQGVNIGGAGATVTGSHQVPPNPPSGLTATGKAGAVALSWSSPATEGATSYTVWGKDLGPPAGSFVNLGSPAVKNFTFTTPLAGHNYQFYVTAANGGGTGLASVTITSAALPAAPTGLTVAPDPVTPTTLDLNWTASSEANLTGYQLVRGTDTASPPAGAITFNLGLVTSYVDPGLNPGTTYFYSLLGVNIGGAGASIISGRQVAPNPPTGLTAIPNSASVFLTWTASASASGYKVYGKDLASGGFSVLGPAATPGFNDTAALPGHSYQYYVTAADNGAVGPPAVLGGTSLDSVTITSGRVPSAPAGFSISGINTNNDISTSWTDVTGTQLNATSLDLFVNSSPTIVGATVINITPPTTTTHTDLGKSAGATFYYWLRANNPFGTGDVMAVPVSQLTYPGAPSLTSVILLPDNVTTQLNWTTTATATSYKIYRALGANGFIPVTTVSAAGLAFPASIQLPVQNGQNYSYKISAVNSTGEGPFSNIQGVFTGPSVPQSVTAVSGLSTSVPQVGVSWALNNVSEGVTTYLVQRASAPGGPFTTVGTLASPTTSYLDSGLSDVTPYYYLLVAESNGVESQVLTTNAVAVIAYEMPNAPTSPSVLAGNGTVNISWTAAGQTSYPVSIYSVTRVSGGVTAVFNSVSSPLVNSGLTNGVTYVYTIQTVDNQGHLSAPTAPVTGLPLAGPSVPGNVAKALGDQAIQITWSSSVPGTYPIGSYQIYKSVGAGPFSLLTTLGPNATGYVDNSPPLNDTLSYSYYVVALDNFGVVPGLDVSANSVTVTGIPVPNNVNPPSNIMASAGVAQNLISWTDSVTVSGAATVISYDVLRSTSQSSGYAAIGNFPPSVSGGSTITDSGLTNGLTYYYYLVAHSSTSVSSNSATVLGIPSAPPTAPTPVAVVDGNTSVTLNWTASPNQGSVTILKYAVIQNILSGSPVTFFTSGPVTTYTDSPLSNGTPVTYQVAAVNSNNTEGSPSSSVISYPYAPFAPTGLTSSASAAAMTLNWTPAGSPSWTVTQFAVLRAPAGGGAATTILTAAPPLIDASGTQGKLYVYSVEAMDNKGHFSAASSPVTDGPAIAPAAPATLIATAGDGQILLDWPATIPAAGAMPVSYYVLTGTDGLNQILPATQTWFLDSPLADPTAVTYTVYAVDISGQVSSPVHVSGNTVSGIATTSASNLNPPTGLAATLTGNAAIKLTWVRPNDEGKIVTSYNIYRAGSFSVGGGSLLANILNPALAPVTVYTDSSVGSSNTYYYVVRAVYGPSSTESPNSNHASAQTPAPGSPVPPVTVGQMAFDANLFLPLTGQKLGIYYDVPNDGVVELDIYNIAGNRIETLVPGMTTANAAHSVFWDGKDRNGHTVASGLYLIEIRATGFHQVKKVAVVK